MIRTLYALLFSIFLHSSAWAEWSYQSKVDAMTDAKVSWASLRSNGYTIMVSETPGGVVLLTLMLSPALNEMVASRTPIIFRVDGHKPIVPPIASWQPRTVTMEIDRQLLTNGRGEFLLQLMQGERLLMRWPVFNGGARDVEFSLQGAAPVLAQALNLSQRLADGSLVKREADRKAYIAKAARCKDNAIKEDYAVCMNRDD